MSAETLLYATLSTNAAISSIAGARVYPDVVPAGQALPAVGFGRIGTEYSRTIHDNAPVAETVTLEVYCMAETRATAETLGDACITALSPAGFLVQDRRSEFDTDNMFYASVLSVDVTTT